MEVKLTYTKKGIEVQVGRAHLPGVYMSDIHAHKAADRYIGAYKKAAEAKSKKK